MTAAVAANKVSRDVTSLRMTNAKHRCMIASLSTISSTTDVKKLFPYDL